MKFNHSKGFFWLPLVLLFITSCSIKKKVSDVLIPDPNCRSVKAVCVDQDGVLVRALEVNVSGNPAWYVGNLLTYSIGDGTSLLFTISQVKVSGNLQTLIDPALNSLVNGQTYELWITSAGITCSFVATFEDCTQIANPESGCCPTPNLITNGDFESGNTGFTSQYTFNNVTLPFLPSEYDILNQATASQMCESWNVDDHTTYCDQAGNFMVANGLNSQSSNTNNVIWETTVTGIQRDSQYRFCANFKDLEQCCFNVNPKIKIVASPGGSTGWITINTNDGNPCDWQLEDLSFTAASTTVNLKILLDHTAYGDGNDLAIDDISLHLKPKTVFGLYADEQASASGTLTVNASINGPTTGDDNLPGPDCDYAWIVANVTNLSPFTIGSPIMADVNGGIYGWGLTTTFPGYPFQSSSGNPKIYVIYMFVYNCDCQGNNYARTFVGGNSGLRAVDIKLKPEQEKALKRQMEEYLAKELAKE